MDWLDCDVWFVFLTLIIGLIEELLSLCALIDCIHQTFGFKRVKCCGSLSINLASGVLTSQTIYFYVSTIMHQDYQ